jgi:phosphoserine aminotransferase
VLEQAQAEMLSYAKSGQSVLEMSHRSKMFENIICQAESDLRSVLSLPTGYKPLLLQGGATMQFAAVPINLLTSEDRNCSHIVSGMWSEKACKECMNFTKPYLLCDCRQASFSKSKFVTIPSIDKWNLSSSKCIGRYLHYCGNETIDGKYFLCPSFAIRCRVS